MTPMKKLTQRRKRGRPKKLPGDSVSTKRRISTKPVTEKTPAACQCAMCAEKRSFAIDLFPLLVEDMRKIAKAHHVTVNQIIEAGISHFIYDAPGDISKELQDHRFDYCFKNLRG